jgi:predicted extracellular nuclease
MADVLINEFVFNHTGTDVFEYVEVFGSPNTDYSNFSVLQIEGDGSVAGTIDSVTPVGTTDANGFFTTPFLNNSFENGTVSLLLVEDFTGSQGEDLDTNDDGVLDVTPWTSIADAVAVSDGGSGDNTYANVVLTPGFDGVSFTPGGASRIPNGVDTDSASDFVRNDFDLAGLPGITGTPEQGEALNTPGAVNALVPPPVPTPGDTRIYDIQGAAQTSPLVGQSVSNVPGIVTAVDSNGFYFQDPTGDSDITTSDGIFVFTNSRPTVSVGDSLLVSGAVSEFIPGGAGTGNLSTTQISGNPTITTVSTGNTLPAPVILGAEGRTPLTEVIDNDQNTAYNVLQGGGVYEPTLDGIDFYESVEGMRVTVNDALAVSATNRFGEIFTVADNGANATNLSERGTINIAPDDFNPERIQIQEDTGIFNFDFPNVDVGAQLGDVTGVVSYGFGNFEVLVTEDFTSNIQPSNLQPETSSLIPTRDQLTIASYNVLNLDPNDTSEPEDESDTDVADGRFNLIASQIVNNLQLPDIVGLQEIQDNDGSVISDITAADQTLQLLVDEIAEISGVSYEFIDNPFIGNNTNGGQPGGNIRTAFLYNPNRVSLAGEPLLDEPFQGSIQTVVDPLDQQTNEDNPFFDTRLPIVGNFTFNGQEVTVINNHFSSKGGSSPLFGQIQPATDLQEDSTVNGDVDDRREQAQAVKDYVDNILANNPNANVVVEGDLNEFEFISPLEILEESLSNLTETLPEDERYSFIFQGNSQALDHILVSPNLVEGVAFDAVHVNTEFAETDQRASDHDPLLARLTLQQEQPPVNPINGTRGDDDILGTPGNDAISGDNGNDTINGLAGNDTIEGGRGGDIIRGGAGDDVLAADRVNRFDDFDGTNSELIGLDGNDTIFGGSKGDFIRGDNGDDVLFGKSGDDRIFGGSDNDSLNGGIGNDTLQGNTGVDTADYSDLTFNGVFGTVAGVDVNLTRRQAQHSSTNNALTWTDTLLNIENVIGTSRNDRFIGDANDNVFDGQGEVGRNDRRTTFTDLDGDVYQVIADVVEYSGNQSEFMFIGSADNFTVTGAGIGTDTLINIEFLKFDDSLVSVSDSLFA